MKKYTCIFVTFCIFSMIVFSCSHSTTSEKLNSINTLTETDPKAAKAALDSLDSHNFSKSDQVLFTLLKIKANDKLYIKHTSDSTIKKVLDYYTHNTSDPYYPTALYYGGRVYADLGDSPTALSYFQQALDEMPENPDYKRMKGHVLSQTGRLLNSLQLYAEAAPYLIKVIEIDKAEKDSVNLAENLLLLGAIYYHDNKLDSATNIIKEAQVIAHELSESTEAKTTMYMAAIENKRGNVKEALNLIRGIPEKIKDDTRHTAEAHAADIYLKANIKDTAYRYTMSLIRDNNNNNLFWAYQNLLTTPLKELVPKDSAVIFSQRMAEIASEHVHKNGSEMAVIQQASYNYKVHDRERAKAEKTKDRLMIFTIIALSILLVGIIVAFIFWYRNKTRIIQLQATISNLKSLNLSIQQKNNSHLNKTVPTDKITEKTLRQIIRDEYLQLYRACAAKPNVAERLLNSSVYAHIQNRINSNELISQDDPLWNEIEIEVLSTSPDFKKNLSLLVGGKLSKENYRMTLLMKFGISASKIASLVGRGRNTISARRNKLTELIYDQKMDASIFDDIISRL